MTRVPVPRQGGSFNQSRKNKVRFCLFWSCLNCFTMKVCWIYECVWIYRWGAAVVLQRESMPNKVNTWYQSTPVVSETTCNWFVYWKECIFDMPDDICLSFSCICTDYGNTTNDHIEVVTEGIHWWVFWTVYLCFVWLTCVVHWLVACVALCFDWNCLVCLICSNFVSTFNTLYLFQLSCRYYYWLIASSLPTTSSTPNAWAPTMVSTLVLFFHLLWVALGSVGAVMALLHLRTQCHDSTNIAPTNTLSNFVFPSNFILQAITSL